MKKLIFLQENILKKIFNNFHYIFFILIFFNFNEANTKEKWSIDNSISYVEFEVPVLLATNVKGKFTDINGFVELDFINNKENKAIFAVKINSLELNYEKYLELIFSNLFFEIDKFPLAIIDTKNFKYTNESEINLNAELIIKNKSEYIPIRITINKFTENLVQVIGKFEFSRTIFNIGTNQWRNTSILKDSISVKSNIFLYKE
tara:strand:- start:544 stop:1155 length:612 start_codon:yes stop_codon:yes gene_type:complete